MTVSEVIRQLVGLSNMCGDDPEFRVELETDGGYNYGGPVTDVHLSFDTEYYRQIDGKMFGARLMVRCARPRIDARPRKEGPT